MQRAGASDCSGPTLRMVLPRRSCSGDQCFFEVLAERGLQRVKLARRGIGQIGFEYLLNPRIPLFLVAFKLLLVGPESDRQHFFGLDLGHKGEDFEEAFLLLQKGRTIRPLGLFGPELEPFVRESLSPQKWRARRRVP
jgi:hypothetical protein